MQGAEPGGGGCGGSGPGGEQQNKPGDDSKEHGRPLTQSKKKSNVEQLGRKAKIQCLACIGPRRRILRLRKAG